MKEENNNMNFDESRLRGIPKKQVFQVPDGYFEKLPSKIQEIISEEKVSVWEKIAAIILRPQIAIVAVLLLILSVVGINYWNKTNVEHENTVAVNTKSQADSANKEINSPLKVEDLSSHQVAQIDQEIIVEEIDEEVILEEDKGNASEQVAMEGESEEVDYLIENNIDLSLIIDEIQID